MSSTRNELILQLLMLDSGIVPYALYDALNSDMGAIDKRIASLEPADRRIVKRKFRKLWRKAASHLDYHLEASGRFGFHRQACGLSKSGPPTQAQRKARRLAVVLYLAEEKFY